MGVRVGALNCRALIQTGNHQSERGAPLFGNNGAPLPSKAGPPIVANTLGVVTLSRVAATGSGILGVPPLLQLKCGRRKERYCADSTARVPPVRSAPKTPYAPPASSLFPKDHTPPH